MLSITTDGGAVVRQSRAALGLSAAAGQQIDTSFLLTSLRRLAGSACPCSASTLVAALTESLFRLVKATEIDEIRDRAHRLIDQLVIYGDLLELSSVTTIDPNAKNSWLFVAPPSFVARPGGSVLLLGIAPDDNSPLPASYAARVMHRGPLRVIAPESADEDLGSVLRGLGLIERSEEAWLRPPRAELAQDYLDRCRRALDAQGPAGEISGLRVLDPTTPVSNYRARWTEPRKRTGEYIGRRPQAYGADIWGLVSLHEGQPQHFLDLPRRGDRYRGCDEAWRLQMAIDAARGAPQQFRVRTGVESGVVLDFLGPLPMWAERRLQLIGKPAKQERAIFSYWLPESELDAEVKFLLNYLWLFRSDSV